MIISIIGFLVMFLISVFFTGLTIICALYGGIDLGPVKGNGWFLVIILGCVTAFLWWLTFTNNPFVISMVN